jgi:GT2 family glycosyltransferase
MSVHNGGHFLRDAVESILGQTFANFEFLVIDDGSTDGSGVLLERFAQRDHRVRVVHQENAGLTRSLNRGLALARGDFIARMDADDVSERNRIQAQLDFLRSHTEITVLGTSDKVIDGAGRTLTEERRPRDPQVVRWAMSYGCALCHPSVIFRRRAIQAVGGYGPGFRYAQDYDLWTRLVMKGTKMSSIPECLVRYRISGSNISVARKQEQRQCALRIGHRYVEWLLQRQVPEEEVSQMQVLLNQRRMASTRLWRRAMALCGELRVRSERQCDPQGIKEIREILSGALLAGARRNARIWPAQSLSMLRESISLLPRRSLDARVLGVMLLCAFGGAAMARSCFRPLVKASGGFHS